MQSRKSIFRSAKPIPEKVLCNTRRQTIRPMKILFHIHLKLAKLSTHLFPSLNMWKTLKFKHLLKLWQFFESIYHNNNKEQYLLMK